MINNKKKMNETKIAEINKLVRKNSRNELVRLCKEKSLSSSGTKHDMAVRLVGGLQEVKEEPDVNTKKLIIRKNRMGLWEYEGLIFDDKTKNVIGRLVDGTIHPLQRKDIETCRQYKFRYTLPDILDERPDAPRTGSVSSDEEDDDLVEEEDDS